MHIVVNGNGNIVAGRDNYINSCVDNSVAGKIPDELLSEYNRVVEYLLDHKNSKQEKESRILKFKEAMISGGASAIVGEVVKYLIALL